MITSQKCPDCKGNGRFMGIEDHAMYCDACGGEGTLLAYMKTRTRLDIVTDLYAAIDNAYTNLETKLKELGL